MAEGAPAVVVLHGIGSGRANHRDYCERLAAAGISAIGLDVRGHGESDGQLDAAMVDDPLAALDWLAEHDAGPLGLRGSSMGGFLALVAATRHEAVRAVVAICPAHQDGLADRRGLTWARDWPLQEFVGRSDGVARGYWHARGDELVPWQWSMVLAGLSPQPRRLHVAMGGHHGSLQHDPHIQTETVAFFRRFLGSGQEGNDDRDDAADHQDGKAGHESRATG